LGALEYFLLFFAILFGCSLGGIFGLICGNVLGDILLDSIGEIGDDCGIISLIVKSSSLNLYLSFISWPLIKTISISLWFIILELWLSGSSNWSWVASSRDSGSWLSLSM